MLKPFRFLLLLPLWLACQTDVAPAFGPDPLVAYIDDAPLTKKTFCQDANCDQLYAEENYLYSAEGQLLKVEYLNRNASGKMEINSYLTHQYNQDGTIASKVRYGRNINAGGWVPQDESEFEYANGVLKREKTYFHQLNATEKSLMGYITYAFKDGKKVEQKWFDANDKLGRSLAYEYKNNVISRETWYDEKGNVIRIFAHTFSGSRRQIGEYLQGSKEQLAIVEKTYDAYGRLSTEKTVVNNPLLCTMTPGMIRYGY